MSAFFEKLISGKTKSANEAKERLRFVLIHDRTDISQEALEELKNEIIHLISNYVEIDSQSVNITIAQDGREQRLIADIPLLIKHRRRIG